MSRLLSSISALSWTRLHSHPDIPFSSPLHWPKVFLSLGLLPCFDLIHPVIPSWGKGSSWEVNVTTCMSKKHLPSHLRSVEHKIPSGYNFPWEIWRHLLHIVSGFQHCYWEIRYHSNSWAFVYQSFFSLSLSENFYALPSIWKVPDQVCWWGLIFHLLYCWLKFAPYLFFSIRLMGIILHLQKCYVILEWQFGWKIIVFIYLLLWWKTHNIKFTIFTILKHILIVQQC